MPVSITSQKSNQTSIAQSVDNYKLDGLEKPKIPFRNVIAVIGSFAASTMFAARCVLSVAIVAMVSTNSEIVSSNDDNSTVVETISFKKTYDFTNAQQGMILGSYFYTYAAFQIFGGIVADKLDVVWLNIITHSLSAAASFLTPYAADLGTAAFVVLRMFMGFTHVTMLATLFTLFANWFPPNEMSIPICLVMGASNLGIAMIMPLTAWMSENESLGGWPMGFFTIGVIEATVPVLFFLFVNSSPQDSRFVSEYEKRYIAKENAGSVGSKSDVKIKWTQILRSPPVWAIVLAKCGIAFGYMMINIKIPAYMEDQLNISLKDNGLLNASMYIILFFAQIASAPASKYLIEKEILSPTTVRKIFESIALVLPAIALFAIPFLGDFKTGVIGALFVAMFALGANTGGDMPLVSEVAPDIAGTLFGVTNTMASAMGIGAPMLSALLLESGLEKSTAWNLTFFFGGAIMILSNIFFIFFATTLPQSWGLSQNRYKNALSAVITDPGSRRVKPYVIRPDGKPPGISRFSVAY